MAKTLLVQHWLLQDIPPMHRALIRRLTSNKLLELFQDPHNRKIIWRVQTGSEPATPSTLRTDVLWAPPTSSPTSSLCNPCEIRLQWSWPPEIYCDFHPQASWIPTGVVYNLATLQARIECALLVGNWTANPKNLVR